MSGWNYWVQLLGYRMMDLLRLSVSVFHQFASAYLDKRGRALP